MLCLSAWNLRIKYIYNSVFLNDDNQKTPSHFMDILMFIHQKTSVLSLFTHQLPDRFEQLRRRTLVQLRWLAISGQTITVFFVYFGLKFSLPLLTCSFIIGCSILLNLFLTNMTKLQKPVREKELITQLIFDIIQLTSLLFLTGELSNPFIMLLSVPVIIGIAGLRPYYGIFLAIIMVISTVILAFFSLPLPWEIPSGLQFPVLYKIGFWLSLIITTAFTAAYT